MRDWRPLFKKMIEIDQYTENLQPIIKKAKEIGLTPMPVSSLEHEEGLQTSAIQIQILGHMVSFRERLGGIIDIAISCNGLNDKGLKKVKEFITSQFGIIFNASYLHCHTTYKAKKNHQSPLLHQIKERFLFC